MFPLIFAYADLFPSYFRFKPILLLFAIFTIESIVDCSDEDSELTSKVSILADISVDASIAESLSMLSTTFGVTPFFSISSEILSKGFVIDSSNFSTPADILLLLLKLRLNFPVATRIPKIIAKTAITAITAIIIFLALVF